MSNDIKLINYVNNVEGNRRRMINYAKEYAPNTPDGLSLTDTVTAFSSAMTEKYLDATAVETTHEVRFFDADGTLLKTETVDHLGTATPPADPTYDSTRLTFQCWGCAIGDDVFGPLESDMDYMAVYKPTNDITYIFLDVDPSYNTDLAVSIPVCVILRRVSNSTTSKVARKLYVDWGDNSEISSYNFTSDANVYKPYYFTHTYAEAGSYEIKIYPDEGIGFSKYWARNDNTMSSSGMSTYFEETSGSTFFWALEEGMLARSGTGNPTYIGSGFTKNSGLKKIYTRALAVTTAGTGSTTFNSLGITNYTPNLDILLISDQIVNLYTGWTSSNQSNYKHTNSPSLFNLSAKHMILPAYLSNYRFDGTNGMLCDAIVINIANTKLLIFRAVSSDDPNKQYAGYHGICLKGNNNTFLDKLIFPDFPSTSVYGSTDAKSAISSDLKWQIFTEDYCVKKYINYSPYPVLVYRPLAYGNNPMTKLVEYHNNHDIYLVDPYANGSTVVIEARSATLGKITKWPARLILSTNTNSSYYLITYLGRYNPIINLSILTRPDNLPLIPSQAYYGVYYFEGINQLIVPTAYNQSLNLSLAYNLSLDNWIHILNNVADLSETTAKTISVQTNIYYDKLLSKYVKYNDETLEYVLCNSTDTGAMTIEAAFNAKNWTISVVSST